MSKKVQLPPISGIMGELPKLNFAFESADPQPPSNQCNSPQFPVIEQKILRSEPLPTAVSSISPREEPASSEETGPDNGRSAPYTLQDDLMIFKVVASYYGYGFHGKIPWSFWQTYKRVTGSNRSNSSLYHHWNGAMKKKYEAFIEGGRLNDCILWLETAVMAEQANPITDQPPIQHSGSPLYHNKSQPSIPIMIQPNSIPTDQPMALVRTGSCNPQAFPFRNFS